MMKKLLLTLLPAIAVASLVGIWVFGSATASPGRTRVIIGFDRAPGAAAESLVRGLGGSIKYTYDLIPAIAAELPAEALEGLAHNPNVAYVEEDLPRRVHDAELDNSWGVNRIDAEVVHLANKGAGVTVAIIDTGIDCTHPDLEANCAGGFNFVANAAFPGGVPFDDYGHGTHVAGTVAALDNVSGVVGVAPEADLYALKVCDSSGSCPTSNIIAALEWASNHNLDIANMSLGSRFASTAERQAVQAAYDAGVLLVASAGNAGNCRGKNNTVEFPAGYDQVIALAATNRDDLRPCFSSSGPDVELAAPGVDVLSTVPTGDCRLCTDTGYREGTGTSMASPHVAGTAALVVAANSGWANDDVRLRLVTTAEDLGAAGRDTSFGYGLVDAENAVLGSTDGNNLPPSPAPTPTPTPTPGETTATPPPTATSTPTVEPGATLDVRVGTDKATYSNRQWVYITVTVTAGPSAVPDASVQAVVTGANDRTRTYTGNTNSQGEATFRFRVHTSRYGTGTYRVAATATKAGYESGTGSTSFQVN